MNIKNSKFVERYKDGLVIYEPLYSSLIEPLELLERALNLPVTITVDNMDITDIFGRIVVELVGSGIELSMPVLTCARLIALSVAGRLYRGSRSPASKTVVEVTTSTATGQIA